MLSSLLRTLSLSVRLSCTPSIMVSSNILLSACPAVPYPPHKPPLQPRSSFPRFSTRPSVQLWHPRASYSTTWTVATPFELSTLAPEQWGKTNPEINTHAPLFNNSATRSPSSLIESCTYILAVPSGPSREHATRYTSSPFFSYTSHSSW